MDDNGHRVPGDPPSLTGPSEGCDRRLFLKLFGTSALAGAGAVAGLGSLSVADAAELQAGVPTDGKRWGLVIDVWKLASEAEYDAIIEACHSAHNVPSIADPRHAIKWIRTEEYKNAFPETDETYLPARIKEKRFLVLCNHCDNPPCVRVCPVKATFKRPDGIVMQDMHRCIGCKFCMVACPYGARSYNWLHPQQHLAKTNPDFPQRTVGVVEKCTFCYERIGHGLAPLCVEASNGALLFGDLNDPQSAVRTAIRDARFVLRRKVELGADPKVFYVV
jgi:molybdopterin-containing oxidoreductase family iron-sulfur binding subunit